MNRRHILAAAALAPLAGCAATTSALTTAGASVGRVAATVATDLTSAASLYAIAKGIGLAAMSVVSPATAAFLTAAFAVADPVVASLPSIAATSTAAAGAASTLLTQANAVLLAAAPAVKAVANKIG